MEQRRLKSKAVGFAHAEVFCEDLTSTEAELFQELSESAGTNQAIALLACLRREAAGPLTIPAESVVDVLAKASADEGDIIVIVRSDKNVYARVLDSLTEDFQLLGPVIGFGRS